MSLRMRKESKQLGESPNKEEILEFLKNARMVKKQIGLLRGIDLSENELKIIHTVVSDLEKEILLLKS